MPIHVLLLTHHFPPANRIGALRPYQIARHLGAEGFKVSVVCGSAPVSDSDENSNLSGFEVVPVNFSSLINYFEQFSSWRSPAAKVFKHVARRFIYPDIHILLSKRMLKAAAALFEEADPPNVIISSAPPFSIHVIARRVAKSYRSPWIADNRDLWAENSLRTSLIARLGRQRDMRFSRYILSAAHTCLTVTCSMAAVLSNSLKGRVPITVVRNGADKVGEKTGADFTGSEKRAMELAYTGLLYEGLRDCTPLLDAISQSRLQANIRFFGSEKKTVDGYRRKYPKLSIKWVGMLPRSIVKERQRVADILFLVVAPGAFHKGTIPGKFYEYLEERKPIIAMCDEDSELAGLIVKHNLGVATRSPSKIRDFMERYNAGQVEKLELPLELTRKFQLKKLNSILRNVSCVGRTPEL